MSAESQLKRERMDCFLTAARHFSSHPQCRLFKQQRGKEEKRTACDPRCLVPCRVTFNFWFPCWCFRNTEQRLCGELHFQSFPFFTSSLESWSVVTPPSSSACANRKDKLSRPVFGTIQKTTQTTKESTPADHRVFLRVSAR